MSVVKISELDEGEPLPGWHDRYFQSQSMSFAYYDIDQGAAIHEHFHPEEEVWFVIEGELEFNINGQSQLAEGNSAAIIPAGAKHWVKALTAARVIIANHPLRPRVSKHPS